jgi:type VI protein secretion system component VasK
MYSGLLGVFVLLWFLGLAVMVWALVDAVNVPDDSMYQSGNKLVWVLIIVLLNWIGAIIYFAFGRPRPGQRPRPGPRQQSAAPPVSPPLRPASSDGAPPMPAPPPPP